MPDGRIQYYSSEDEIYIPFALYDYEQFRATHPEGPEMHPQFLLPEVEEDQDETECYEDKNNEEFFEISPQDIMGLRNTVQDDSEQDDTARNEDMSEIILPVSYAQAAAGDDENQRTFDSWDADFEFSEDARSEISSGFVHTPERMRSPEKTDDHIPPSPFKRPSNPEPCERPESYDDDFIFSDDSQIAEEVESDPEEETHPLVRLPSRDHYIQHTSTSEDQEDSNAEPEVNNTGTDVVPVSTSITKKDTNEVEDPYAPPTSRYRVRATQSSWTGLEITSWGSHSYIHGVDGTMGLFREWEIESESQHNQLQKCRFGGFSDPDRVPPPPVMPEHVGWQVPELILTTDEGENFWLDDCHSRYEPGSDEFQFEGKPFGHICNENCADFFEEFGWDLLPSKQLALLEEKIDEKDAAKAAAQKEAKEAARLQQEKIKELERREKIKDSEDWKGIAALKEYLMNLEERALLLPPKRFNKKGPHMVGCMAMPQLDTIAEINEDYSEQDSDSDRRSSLSTDNNSNTEEDESSELSEFDSFQSDSQPAGSGLAALLKEGNAIFKQMNEQNARDAADAAAATTAQQLTEIKQTTTSSAPITTAAPKTSGSTYNPNVNWSDIDDDEDDFFDAEALASFERENAALRARTQRA
ncbi:uncharacterized protein C8A04DRAFT_28340 [Dichotomopilus funicola]|uniref:Uncharacterized protein n=1 Tax=Dichotomopilus funicola TaxID=1934379 RepID=A0AAN6ZNB6_9PEZI|nr:hypothetical protein C8A04DRAFT_28340 [Dichotomopilus funicola]